MLGNQAHGENHSPDAWVNWVSTFASAQMIQIDRMIQILVLLS
jgi:hypothetical protein